MQSLTRLLACATVLTTGCGIEQDTADLSWLNGPTDTVLCSRVGGSTNTLLFITHAGGGQRLIVDFDSWMDGFESDATPDDWDLYAQSLIGKRLELTLGDEHRALLETWGASDPITEPCALDGAWDWPAMTSQSVEVTGDLLLWVEDTVASPSLGTTETEAEDLFPRHAAFNVTLSNLETDRVTEDGEHFLSEWSAKDLSVSIVSRCGQGGSIPCVEYL